MSHVPSVPPGGGTSLGVAPNVGGALSYAPCCVGLLFSVAVVAMEKHSRFLRFHAFQSLLIYAAAFAVVLVLTVLGMILGSIAGVLGFLVNMVMGIFGLAMLALEVLLMMKAYGGEEIELPVVGEMARKWM